MYARASGVCMERDGMCASERMWARNPYNNIYSIAKCIDQFGWSIKLNCAGTQQHKSLEWTEGQRTLAGFALSLTGTLYSYECSRVETIMRTWWRVMAQPPQFIDIHFRTKANFTVCRPCELKYAEAHACVVHILVYVWTCSMNETNFACVVLVVQGEPKRDDVLVADGFYAQTEICAIVLHTRSVTEWHARESIWCFQPAIVMKFDGIRA